MYTHGSQIQFVQADKSQKIFLVNQNQYNILTEEFYNTQIYTDAIQT